ncbi:probable carboxylesterase 18 [Pistacia vera]|uniref:probable carboxylesterase 18 n=1 Tax=Pistacia vera TaxID=55513 RepID=UPI0012639B7B|nr:probable carboxylesterase 18 [Pistacia vera]
MGNLKLLCTIYYLFLRPKWFPHPLSRVKQSAGYRLYWGTKVDVVGFCFLYLASNYEPPESLVKRLDADTEPIYIGFGSLPVQEPEKMTQVIVEALEITGQSGIINKGWVALATVHHGGAGITAAGLKAAVKKRAVELAKSMEKEDGVIGAVKAFFKHYPCPKAQTKPETRGFLDSSKTVVRKLPAVIISVNYRLAPEHRCPSQYENGFDLLNFIDTNLNSIESLPSYADFNHCFNAGDSAGSNIAHHVALRAVQNNLTRVKIIGVLAIQPYFGGEERTPSEITHEGAPLISIERTDWTWKAFLPERSDRDHGAANVFGPKGHDISGVNFPATIVFVGGFDPSKNWQTGYFQGLTDRGKEAELVEFDNACHCFYLFPKLPEFDQFVDRVRQFING